MVYFAIISGALAAAAFLVQQAIGRAFDEIERMDPERL